VRVLAWEREVKLERDLLSCVGTQRHVVRLHVLALEHGHCALGNLVKQREALCLRRNVGQDHLAFVRRAAQERVGTTRQLLAFVTTAELLVAMDHLDVALQVQVCLGDELLVQDHVAASSNRDSALVIGSKLVVRRWFERQVEDELNQEDLLLAHSAVDEVV